jgi:hypothetical protein
MLVLEVGLERFGDDMGLLDFSVFQAPFNPSTVQLIYQSRRKVEGHHLALFWCPLLPGLLGFWRVRRLLWCGGALLFLEKDVRAFAFNVWSFSACGHTYVISWANAR